jgi:choice-of-anchor B domain-containing protein
MADIYPCKNIDLLHRVHIDAMGGDQNTTGSDIWGWTDAATGKEYAIMGLSNGTSFVDISEPKFPVYLGHLPTATINSKWRDIKTYKNHAYIVSEATDHGVQVFDLTQLRNITEPQVFSVTTRYTRVGSIHNIAINESTGYAYVVGGREGNAECNSGLHMININSPANPVFSGCYATDGYTHDAQCVIYNGTDFTYSGREICFNSNEDTLTIVDVTNKSNPIQLSRTGYDNSQYTHQGWLTEDHRYFLMNDEQDEQELGHNTKTYIWDMFDLNNPELIGFYNGPKASIDHNIYIKGNYAYLTNYTSGLSIVDIKDIGSGLLQETANFDGYPAHDLAVFSGAWSNYPYFESGSVIMSDKWGGLFILEPQLCPVIPATTGLSAIGTNDNEISLKWDNDLNSDESYNVYRSDGGCDINDFKLVGENIGTNSFVDTSVTGSAKVGYKIAKTSFDSELGCESTRSVCVETQTTGICSIAPSFTGIKSVSSSNTLSCGIDIQWQDASSYCDAEVSYDVFKSINPDFQANEDTLIATNVSNLEWHDIAVDYKQDYYYLVRATDTSNQSQDTNVVKLSNRAVGELVNEDWSAGAEIGDFGFDNASKSGSIAKHLGWETVSDKQFSGERSYWSQNNSNNCNTLVSNSIQLTENKSSELSFWTMFDIENRYDGGVVEISTDDDSWVPLLLSPDYPSNFNDSQNACQFPAGTPSFSGKDSIWKQHSVNLSQYQGQEVKLRWSYSSDQAIDGDGWFIDDINITNTQIGGVCERAPDKPQNGLWYDRNHSGHGFVVEPIGRDDLYFTVFYSYKEDGTSEWYTSLATLENNILNVNLVSDTLLRFIRDYDTNSNVLDTSTGTNILQIDFNSQTAIGNSICNDNPLRPQEGLAIANWQLGEQQGSWCIEPLIAKDSYPTPDFGGTWWTGTNDSGWGISLSFSGDLLVATVYYFDAAGNARWVQGIQPGFVIGEEITLEMIEYEGFARDATPTALIGSTAGSLSLTLNNNSQSLKSDGILSIDVSYQGNEGGNWSRSNMPVTIFTQPH